MICKYLFLLGHLTLLGRFVYGDPLQDFATKKLRDISKWMKENVADELFVSEKNFPVYSNSWIEYNLNSVNYVVKGLSSIELMHGRASAYANVYAGRFQVRVPVNMSITITGTYEIDGVLFPLIDQIPFTNFGLWSVNMNMKWFMPRYDASIYISMNSSIFFDFNAPVTDNVIIDVFEVHNFLPEHIDQWYHQIVKESFANALRSNMEPKLYHHLDQLKPFFEETFKDITYFDIVGSP